METALLVAAIITGCALLFLIVYGLYKGMNVSRLISTAAKIADIAMSSKTTEEFVNRFQLLARAGVFKPHLKELEKILKKWAGGKYTILDSDKAEEIIKAWKDGRK